MEAVIEGNEAWSEISSHATTVKEKMASSQTTFPSRKKLPFLEGPLFPRLPLALSSSTPMTSGFLQAAAGDLAGVVNRRGSGGGQFWQRRCVGEKLGLSSIDVTDVEVREESSVGTTWWGGGKGSSSGKSFPWSPVTAR
ncbi:hypothetical protein BHE74_00000440 [Ensete ventricosum]|nr:hypothetical protein BHE74_00000440 [Ensete ventricosum]